MEQEPKEHVINPSSRIWLDNEMVEPGIYDQYRKVRDLVTGTRSVVLRQHGLKEYAINLDTTAIYLEHCPSARKFDTDRLSKDFPDGRLKDWPKMLVQGKTFRAEGPHPFQPPVADPNLNDHIYIPAQRLRETGSLGFYILNCGIRQDFTIDQIIGIGETPAQHLVTVFWQDETHTVKTSTYNFTKITLVRHSPRTA